MKIFITGPVASGKSTLATTLKELLGINCYSIDRIVHDDENNCKRTEKEQRKLINGIIRKDKEWIIEGIPRTHLEVVSSNATTIIYLDFDKKDLKKQLKKRNKDIRSGKLKVPYELTEELLNKMNRYIEEETYEDKYYLMKKYPSKLIIIKNKKEIDKLIKAITDGEELKYQ